MGASWGKSTIFLTLMFWCALWTAWNWLTTTGYPFEAYAQILQILLSWSALFLVGIFVDPSRRQVFQLCFISIVAMLAVSLRYIDISTGMVDLRIIFGAGDIPSYRSFASATMMTALLFLSGIQKLHWRLFWSVPCAALLFVEGARSEFVGFIAAVGVVDGTAMLKQPKALLSIGIAAIPAFFIVNEKWADIEQSRQFQLLDIGNASSWIARQEFLQFALNQITAHPFAGVFAGHLEWEWPVSVGAYAHNVISVWVSFGIVGFALYSILVASSVKTSFTVLRQTKGSPVSRLSAYVNTLSLVLIIASMSVFWPIVALGWGLAINSAAKSKETRHLTPRKGSKLQRAQPILVET
ncbi:MAG: hypothetical protein QM744_17470 [Mesorhizobium sp.]